LAQNKLILDRSCSNPCILARSWATTGR